MKQHSEKVLLYLVEIKITKEENMLITSIYIVAGFILLIVGADLLVRGSSNIAKRFHIPEMMIGLTIVAIRNINARTYDNN